MHRPSIADLVLPSKKMLLVYGVLLIMVIIINTPFVQQQLDQLQLANEITRPFIQGVYQDTSTAINQDTALSKLSIGLVWGAIGAVVYILFWMGSNILREMRNIVVEELYFVKPNQDSLWRGRMQLAGQVLYRMGLVALIACFVMVVGSIVFPFVMQTVRTALESVPQVLDVALSAAALLVLSVSLHAVVILIRLLTVRNSLSTQVMSK